MAEIIHIAGPVITFGSVARQRCSWCGALIQERDVAMMACVESERAPERQGKPLDFEEIGWWHGLVAIDGTNPVMLYAVDDPPDGKAPERSCMMLLPSEPDVLSVKGG